MEDFNTPSSSVDSITGQTMHKETTHLIHTMGKVDLMNTYRTSLPTVTGHAFWSLMHEAYSRMDHMLGHQTRISKEKKKKISHHVSFPTTMERSWTQGLGFSTF